MGLPVDAAALEDADQIKGVNTLETACRSRRDNEVKIR